MAAENISIFVAFLAGLVSFLSPCVLPLVPAYIGHLVGATAAVTAVPDRSNSSGSTLAFNDTNTGTVERRGYAAAARAVALTHAAVFVLGFGLVFVTFWASLSAIGQFLPGYIRYVRPLGGVILILLGLNMAGVLRISFLFRTFGFEKKSWSGDKYKTEHRPGLPSSFFTGVLFAAGWTPCIGTVLGGIIGLASESATAVQGVYLLVAYSLGLGVPFMLCALALGQANAMLKRLNRNLNRTRLIAMISGLFVVAVGVLMLTNTFQTMSAYFNWLPL